MSIKFRCPHCQQFLGISESKAGSIADCPTCGHSLRVPDRDGTISPLPAPQLNLQDEGLLSALGELASLQHTELSSHDPAGESRPLPSILTLSSSPLPDPVIKDAGPVLPSPEVVLNQEVPPHPVAHIEDTEDSSTTAAAILSELARESGSASRPETSTGDSEPPLFSNRAWTGMVLTAFLCGVFLGMALRGGSHSRRPFPSEHSPDNPSSPNLPEVAPSPLAQQQAPVQAAAPEDSQPCSITGTITYPDATGTLLPDRGARILLLPLGRTGTTKLSGPALRVGADPLDRQLLQAAAQALGGAFQTADEQGRFNLTPVSAGRYGLLVASQHQGRPSGTPLTDHCRDFLSNCFERPQLTLGDVAYSYAEVSIEAGHPLVRDVAFQAR